MVKADPKRNYYADLELSANAGDEEIKKQFRLLAKLYHPDRNRGHEVEFVDKFQAIQQANEILSDPSEKSKYDTARAKLQSRQSAPQAPKDDPYGFRRPAGPARTQTTAAQATPQAKMRPRSAFNATQPREPPASAGAEKVAAFARPQPQTWTRERYEEAARAEAARGFSTMRSQAPPPQPPRPPRQHPTAPRPPSTGPDQQYPPNGFPGMARTAARRRQYPDYNYVRPGRPPPATQTHGAENLSPQSPQQARTAAASPLRHTRSTEYSSKPERPGLYARADGRYSSNTGEKTDIHGGLHRSASVRNSPVDPVFEESGPFRRYRTQGDPPRRHHSTSPKRSVSFSSSDTSDEDPVYMNHDRPKTKPKPPRVFTKTNTGLDQQFPGTSYTRVVDEDQPYVYPPPPPKQPVRHPFPNMTSPDESHPPDQSQFRYELTRCFGKGHSVNGLPSWAVPSSIQITHTNFASNGGTNSPKHDDVFRAANFSHQDWAEKLKSTSPVKRGPKMRRAPTSQSDTSPGDAMDVDSNEPSAPQRSQTDGLNFDDFKDQAPFKSEGLNGVDDLKHDLPWESRASTHVRTDSKTQATRLRTSDFPQPPKPISPPSLDHLNNENWKRYIATMKEYVAQWDLFELNMIEHFKQRRIRMRTCMSDNWISMPSDGPRAEQVEALNGVACTADGLKAGYGAYMQWLMDDEMCHAWWDRAGEMHKQVMEELGQVRDKLMSADTAAV